MIKIKTEMYVPPGMYCKNRNECRFFKISTNKYDSGREYCELFGPYTKTESNGKPLKCEKCLLATRKAMEG